MPSVEVSVTNGADDGGDDDQTSWDTSALGINLDYGDWHCFFRFASVTIPAGAIIGAGCYLSLNTWYTTGTVRTKVSADDQATPAAPTSWAELDGITLTTAKVDWDDVPDADGFTNSPGIQNIIAELQGDYDYSGGAPIQLLVIHDTGGGGRTSVNTYDKGPEYAALLHIEYTVGGVTHEGAATLSGIGTLAGIGRGIFIGKSTLSGTGTLSSIGRLIATGKVTLSGAGTLSAIGSFLRYGIATLSGVGTLAGIGTVLKIVYGKATLAGIGTLSGIGRLIATGKATLSGIGSLSAIGTVIAIGIIHYGKAIFSGIGILSGVGTIVTRVKNIQVMRVKLSRLAIFRLVISRMKRTREV